MALLATLSNKQRSQLCTVLKAIHVPQGTMLVARGEVGDAFYIIESGICQVLNDTNQARPPLPVRLFSSNPRHLPHQSSPASARSSSTPTRHDPLALLFSSDPRRLLRCRGQYLPGPQ